MNAERLGQFLADPQNHKYLSQPSVANLGNGHFVANCRVEAVADWLSFVQTYLATGTPNIP